MAKGKDSGVQYVAGCGAKMQSLLTMNESGAIHLKTHTFTDCQGAGFHGGTHAYFFDKNGNLIYQTPTEVYGVDGKAYFWLVSSRWDDRYYKVDPSIYNDTERIDLLVFHNGKNVVLDDIKQVADIAGKVFTLFHSLYQGQGIVQTSGSPFGPEDNGEYLTKVGDNILHGSYVKNLINSNSGSQVKYGDYISLKTYDETHYICAENGGGKGVVANRTEPHQWESFRIINTDGRVEGSDVKYGDSVWLQTYDRKHYICAENGSGRELVANREEPHTWEAFWIIGPNGKIDGSDVKYGDLISLKTGDAKCYICAENGGGGEVNANRAEAHQWETFTIYQN